MPNANMSADPAMRSIAEFNAVSMNTRRLINDVTKAVGEGQSIKLSKWDRLNAFGRMLKDSAASLAISGVKLVITAVTATPLAALVSAGTQVVTAAVKALWVAGMCAWKNRRIKTALRAGNRPFNENTWNGDFAPLVADVRYLLKNGGLTHIQDAYINLDKDWKLLVKNWVDAPPEPVKASERLIIYQGYEVEVNGKKEVRYGGAKKKRLVMAARAIENCDDAVLLWENLARVSYRFAELREVFGGLDMLVMWVTGKISIADASERAMQEAAWRRISENESATPEVVMKRLNDAANKVRNKWFRRIWSRDYYAWAFAALPESVRNSDFGELLQFEVMRHADSSQYKKLVKEARAAFQQLSPGMAKSLTDAEVVAAVYLGAKHKDPTKVAENLPASFSGQLKSAMRSIGSAQRRNWTDAAKDGVAEGLKEIPKHAFDKVMEETKVSEIDLVNQAHFVHEFATSSAFRADSWHIFVSNLDFTSFATGAITGILSAIVRIALEAWNEWQLENDRTFGIKGWSNLSREARLAILKGMTNDKLEAYTEAADALYKAYEQLEGAGSGDSSAEGLMAYHMARGHLYANKVGALFEQIVGDANYYGEMAENFALCEGAQAIERFMADHRDACASSGCCYADLLDAVRARYLPIPPDFERQLDNKALPVHPIGQKKDNFTIYFEGLKETLKNAKKAA